MVALQGQLGIELARQHGPDLILLDLNLPDMNGEAVLARLKADPATRDVPVVVVSADATARQIERLRASGADEYLTKPLDIAHFLRGIDALVVEGAGPSMPSSVVGLPLANRAVRVFETDLSPQTVERDPAASPMAQAPRADARDQT